MGYNKLILKTNAAIEIENAIAYYALINKVLAKRIEKEIRFGFNAIAENPENFQCRYFEIRIFWLDRFPYSLYYISENSEVSILAFWHTKEDIPNKLSKIV
ncbi:type II toxin-antitoxin system RelE/ParE family toxin [Flavobacterium xanthum]|uniref:Plasmid stabilization system protein ParE n=1 Tax=Flavobacterium xanthum TaxID=69322 RepID=A0A1M7CK86_9FLAO|nr:type II toxin-antitoxin system RelE/ParE family toxin [Flavobacterium xanthum]SHL67625.1 Plasmid stabilization system protein ParE [Flavobacterium xanthum]